MRWWLSQHVVPLYKKMRIFGGLRFKTLRIIYKIFWPSCPRNGEWEFVLSWLRPLRSWQKPVTVLDVGSTESLLIYELLCRGYEPLGIDQRPYQEENPRTMVEDILNPIKLKILKCKFDYILAISTVEHIGLGAYKDKKKKGGDRKALENLRQFLKDDGYFIITIPNKHLGTDTGRGYSYRKFEELIDGLYKIVHFEERSNQICSVLVKS